MGALGNGVGGGVLLLRGFVRREAATGWTRGAAPGTVTSDRLRGH